jgi:hypothetical protein
MGHRPALSKGKRGGCARHRSFLHSPQRVAAYRSLVMRQDVDTQLAGRLVRGDVGDGQVGPVAGLGPTSNQLHREIQLALPALEGVACGGGRDHVERDDEPVVKNRVVGVAAISIPDLRLDG